MTLIVIPARKGSTRFPGKPMARIAGRSLLERVWRIAKAAKGADEVVVATDDAEIEALAKGFGAKAVRTRPECRNGSERAFEAARALAHAPEFVVNLQGDAPLTPPWVVEAAIAALKADPSVGIATPAARLSWEQYDRYLESKAGGRASGTTVVFDKDHAALYFSKAAIPFVRSRKGECPVWKHIGLYAYRFATLAAYCALEPSRLEETEQLEQLRALENGLPIRVVPVDYRGRSAWSIDNPEDVAIAERIIAEEGELA